MIKKNKIDFLFSYINKMAFYWYGTSKVECQQIPCKMKISDIDMLSKNGKLVKLPHQRQPKKKNKSEVRRLINKAINNELTMPFQFSDLISNLEYCTENNLNSDVAFFKRYIDDGKLFSTEDGLQKCSVLTVIKDDDFENAEEKQKFYDSIVNVIILKRYDRNKLISTFQNTNSAFPVTNPEILWGVPNEFNKSIKTFIQHLIVRVYNNNVKNTSQAERDFYKNFIKIMKVCSFYSNVYGTSSSTNKKSLVEFIEANKSFRLFKDILDLFSLWTMYISNNLTKTKFVTQSNLFFIIHILKNQGKPITQDGVNAIMNKLKDTRSSPEKRYKWILEKKYELQ